MSNTSMVSAETQHHLTPEKIEILEQSGIIPANTPPAQIAVFAEVANRHGLDPFLKQIHLVGYAGKYSVIVGIDGYRSRAEATGLHAGTDEAKFDMGSNGQYKSAMEIHKQLVPVTATVTVWKVVGGTRVPFTHTALFKEFSSGKQKWQTMPFQMLAKVAESHALRKAFPNVLSGLHIQEEVDAINDTVEVEHREETEAERLDTATREAVNEILRGMDAEERKPLISVIKRKWSDNTFADGVRAKFAANELTETYLLNYCEGLNDAE